MSLRVENIHILPIRAYLEDAEGFNIGRIASLKEAGKEDFYAKRDGQIHRPTVNLQHILGKAAEACMGDWLGLSYLKKAKKFGSYSHDADLWGEFSLGCKLSMRSSQTYQSGIADEPTPGWVFEKSSFPCRFRHDFFLLSVLIDEDLKTSKFPWDDAWGIQVRWLVKPSTIAPLFKIPARETLRASKWVLRDQDLYGTEALDLRKYDFETILRILRK